MGRPRTEPTGRVSTAIRLRPDLHEALAVAAQERDVSMNFLVNRAVERFLSRLIPVEEMKFTLDD